MSKPLDAGSARPPRVIGEGCLQRYDPDDLSGEDGTDFAEAAALWQQLQQLPPEKEQRDD